MKNFLTQLAALLSLPVLFINSFGGIIALFNKVNLIEKKYTDLMIV